MDFFCLGTSYLRSHTPVLRRIPVKGFVCLNSVKGFVCLIFKRIHSFIFTICFILIMAAVALKPKAKLGPK